MRVGFRDFQRFDWTRKLRDLSRVRLGEVQKYRQDAIKSCGVQGQTKLFVPPRLEPSIGAFVPTRDID